MKHEVLHTEEHVSNKKNTERQSHVIETKVVVVSQARIPLKILISFHQKCKHVLSFDFDPHTIRLKAKCSKGVVSLLGYWLLATFSREPDPLIILLIPHEQSIHYTSRPNGNIVYIDYPFVT